MATNPALKGVYTSLRLWRYFAPRLLRIRDFSGGLNVREAPPELAPNESPDLWNVTLDERGGVAKRLGYVKVNLSQYGGGGGATFYGDGTYGAGLYGGPSGGGYVLNIFYSGVLGDIVVQAGPGLFTGTNATARYVFTTSQRCGLCEFNGQVWAYHPTDGLFNSSDGITWAQAGNRGSFTVTIASPAVFTTPAAHGLQAGDQVIFQTTGALPTGLTAGTTYYVISAGLTATSFEVAATAGGSAINTSGVQSGTHTMFFPTPKGDSIVSWQNRLICNDSTTGSQINASAIGDGNNFHTSTGNGWTNQIRENPRDGSRILCLASASGVDIAGRPGLIACKRDSTYRLYDSSTGAYSTLDPSIGAASTISVTNLFGKTIILSRFGIFWTDGINPLTKASARVDPRFTPDALNESQLDLCAAGAFGDRCYFSIPTKTATANNLAFEYHPLEGWITEGSNAASCYTTYAQQTQKLYFGSPTIVGQVYQGLTGGSDDGAAIQSWFQTKWFEAADGYFMRARKARILGRGTFNVYTRFNYSVGQGALRNVMISGGGFTWGTGSWGAGVWGPTTYQNYSDSLLSLGTGRAVSFRIEETSSLATTAPPLPGTTDALTVGAWALNGIDLQWIQLGID